MNAPEKWELGKGSPIDEPVDTPMSNSPPSGPAELIVKEEEANASEKGEPNKERPVDGPMDTPPSNPPLAGLIVRPEELIVKQEWIELCE